MEPGLTRGRFNPLSIASKPGLTTILVTMWQFYYCSLVNHCTAKTSLSHYIMRKYFSCQIWFYFNQLNLYKKKLKTNYIKNNCEEFTSGSSLMKLIQQDPVRPQLSYPHPFPRKEMRSHYFSEYHFSKFTSISLHFTSCHSIKLFSFNFRISFFFPWQGFFSLKVFIMQTAELQTLEAPHSSDSSGMSYNRAGVHLPCTHRDGSHPQTAAHHSSSNILKSLRR